MKKIKVRRQQGSAADDLFGGAAAEAKVKEPEEQLNELQQKFRDARQHERALFLSTTDSEYWCCLCFLTRAQKDAFLEAMKWVDFSEGDKYLDGTRIAKQMGIDLPNERIRYAKQKPELTDFALIEDPKEKGR